MRKLLLIILMAAQTGLAMAQPLLDYYLPSGSKYNPAIPTPESVLGFSPGEYHLTWPALVRYLEALDRASERISLVRIGESYEKQPLLQLVITSPENQLNLEKLRKDHLAAIEPRNSQLIRGKDPLVVWLGYSVHGNEPSGANASAVVAWHLAACEDEKVVAMLDQTVILLDPCINPDGLNRFAFFVNSRKSENNNPDLNSFEFQEPWPGGRSNHYWFDLNRDWLPLQHPETQAVVRQFHNWMPNVVTDHHEMGSNSTFFFQPGVPSRTNPLVPPGNFALTQKIGTYNARALDKLGSLYFSEETFDDFYFGKGSSYPDVHGSIGILFEQASSRGHLRKTDGGELSFPFTIRNQVTVSLATLEASFDLKKELHYYMADFFRSALQEADNSPSVGYLFGDRLDPYRNRMMLDLLLRHQVRVQEVTRPAEISGYSFRPGSSWFVPCKQPQYRLLRSMFESITRFADSTFYDVSAWQVPAAFGIPCVSVDARAMVKVQTGNDLTGLPSEEGRVIGTESPVGYLVPCDPYLFYRSLYRLLDQGITVKIATSPFEIDFGQSRTKFQAGTLLVPAAGQPLPGADLYYTLSQFAASDGLSVYPAPTGYTPGGPDLGSGRFVTVRKPVILSFSGSGDAGIAGEVWHQLDYRFGIPLTMTDIRRIGSVRLEDYTVMIVHGPMEADAAALDRIREWTRSGGLLIGIESGCGFLAKNGFAKLQEVEAPAAQTAPKDPRPWIRRSTDGAGRSIPGSIFMAAADTTHPLAFGYHTPEIAVFKEGRSYYQPTGDIYENPVVFTGNPLLSGYIPASDIRLLANSSAVQRQTLGRGKVVLLLNDPLFRGFWAGTHRLFMNAVFWGGL